jgi:hypothetical protein
MKLKKGSKEAKAFMAKIRAAKGKPKKKVSGWNKGGTFIIESGESKPAKANKVLKVTRRKVVKPGTFKDFTRVGVLSGLSRKIAGLFDIKTITDLDSLKQEYRKLALIYHPDKGGTTAQFQELQNEYDKLRDKILSGSTLSEEEKENEIVIDEAIRNAINAVINLEGINIQLIGKWVWCSGLTYPVRTVFSSAGFKPIKKDNIFYWVYKGVESKSRGGTDFNDIVKKYGSKPIKPKGSGGKLNGINKTITLTQKRKFKAALLKLKKAINKRII